MFPSDDLWDWGVRVSIRARGPMNGRSRAGPYAIVRHPMYLGVVFFTAGSGLALGSYWAALILVPIIPVFIRRTILEDRMLHTEAPRNERGAERSRWSGSARPWYPAAQQ